MELDKVFLFAVISAREASHCEPVDVVALSSSMNGCAKLMAEKIKPGTILIKEGTLLPESVCSESEPYTKGWRPVKNLDGYELDQRISKAGWTFFSMVGKVKATGLGFGGEKALRRAMKRVIANLDSKKFNCLEITQVGERHFLGLTCMSVSAYPRQIQRAPWAKDFAEWDRAKLAPVCTQP